MSKKDLASYLGTTPETISRKMCEFEVLGYIKQKTRKRIEKQLLSREQLRSLIQEENLKTPEDSHEFAEPGMSV